MATHSIDIPGLLRNSLSVGVSIPDALSEEIENSLSAGSTEIRLNLSNNHLIISDNGWGMDPDKLEQSCCLHSRTTSSGEHHGRFGFGSKQAEIILTNLEGPVTKFSSVNGNDISQITVNYPKILQTGVYYPQVGGIQCDSRHTWDKNAIDPVGSGTITCIVLSPVTQCALSELITNETVAGIRFKFATTYCDALTKGVKIAIQFGDTSYQIHPIDRLGTSLIEGQLPPNVQFEHESHAIANLQNTITGEIVTHVMCPNGTRMGLDKTHKKFVHMPEECMGSLEHIGDTKCSFAYSNNWSLVQKCDLEKNGITPLHDKQNGIQMFRKKTNGTEIVRNGKMLKHIQSKPITNGDKAAYKYHEQTRTRAEFIANEQMDELYNVQVNKSQVNEELIKKSMWNTIERLRQIFINKCYKTLEPVKDSSEVQSAPSPAHSSAPSPSLSSSPSPRSSPPSLSLSPSVRVQLAPAKSASVSVSASKSKLTPLVSSAPLMNSHSIATSESESVSDNAGVGGGVAAVAVAVEDVTNFVPDSVHPVGPSVHQSINCAKGENTILHWFRSGQHVPKLNEIVDDIIKAYQGRCAPDQLDDTLQFALNYVPIEHKCNHLIHLIKKRHALPEDRMFKGIELLRAHEEAFGAEVGL
jgi:hypothetical protein